MTRQDDAAVHTGDSAGPALLGPDHPSSLALLVNQALDLRGLGRTDEADSLQQRVIQSLTQVLGSGHPATNAVRKRFTRWGAGRLALALAPAATHCLAISDVADDDLSVIGSGPCVPDTTTVKDVLGILQRANLLTRIPQTHRDYLTAVTRGAIAETPTKAHPAFAHVGARVIGNNRLAVEGAGAYMRERHFDVVVSDTRLAGEAARVGETIARELLAAVPIPDPDIQPARLARARPGEPPSPLSPPSGCVYRTRCPHAAPVCEQRAPAWEELPDARRVACHRWRELP